YCSSATSVTNSRSPKTSSFVWRRRKCKQCSAIWTTRENYDLSTTHRVKVSSTGASEHFRRDLLLLSVHEAIKHVKHPEDIAGDLTDTVISKLLALKEPVISTRSIIDVTHGTLKAYDHTAAAVYKALRYV
ncbi:MAG: transcriptional regulator NrdR family protein, partial [Candidatus Saccharimonadales bacterium]